MPRRSQNDAVAERTAQRLAEAQERRREAARQAARTRRERRQAAAAEEQPRAQTERPAGGDVARQARPDAQPEMVTIAVRGPLAAKVRQIAEARGLSLAKLVGEMVSEYEGRQAASPQAGA